MCIAVFHVVFVLGLGIGVVKPMTTLGFYEDVVWKMFDELVQLRCYSWKEAKTLPPVAAKRNPCLRSYIFCVRVWRREGVYELGDGTGPVKKLPQWVFPVRG